jgi:putative SOS response-associated peptidase YedK
MCGRFTLTVDLSELAGAFPWLLVPDRPVAPRFNIAPTQPVAVAANRDDRKLDFFTWGLIPSWADDPAIGSRMINARAETLAEKPSFRSAYRRRRCLIFADGFYEWHKEAGRSQKTPYYIHLKSGAPFGFAGLWEAWNSPHGDVILSCTIITTEPNDLVAQLHNRMPVILPPEAHDRWLDPAEKGPEELGSLLAPYPADQMEIYPVSTLVNNPSNDIPDCIAAFSG